MNKLVELRLTDEQAKITARACEFYARIILGQFNELILELVNSDNIDRVAECKDLIENELLHARGYFYPELHGLGHSYGIGKFEHADKAYDVYQSIRSLFGDPRTPFSYHELPEAQHFLDLK